ncbi:hypothetical protein KR222_001084 [Zaprionus bogoriensis]|nr:hypothetical protein KR222_001084 [Zaprionus bogoriensis]
MGCITSSNKLHELSQENVFRVRVAHLQPSGPEAPIVRSGYLELTPRELIFVTPGYEPIVWALQHLRRYGLNGDLFSFEAGRRCMSGPGIYTFRIHNAEQLYPMFQRYINAVNTDAFAQGERERERERERGRERVNSTHSVSVLLGRGDVQPQSNNYLEPAPLMARSAVQAQQSQSQLQLQQQQLASEMDNSPDTLQSPITPGAYINTNANLYFDQPLQRLLQEQQQQQQQEGTPTSSSSIMQQQPDMPPLESAPALSECIRLYANVETPRERLHCELLPAERCYENISRLDLPLLPRDASQQSVASAGAAAACQQPATPTSLSGVNYIVLDLDQPRSPAQCSPKTLSNGFGSGLSLTTTAPLTPEALGSAQLDNALHRSLNATGMSAGTTPTAEPVATLGYSTIDFIRTYALNKSSTAPTHDAESLTCQHHHSQQQPEHAHEDCELRSMAKQQHGKCVRKAYSISE